MNKYRSQQQNEDFQNTESDVVYNFTGMPDGPLFNLDKLVNGSVLVQDLMVEHYRLLGIYEAMSGGDRQDSNPASYANGVYGSGMNRQRENGITVGGTTMVTLPFHGRIHANSTLGFILKRTKILVENYMDGMRRNNYAPIRPLQYTPWNSRFEVYPLTYSPPSSFNESINYVDPYAGEVVNGKVYIIGNPVHQLTDKHPRVNISEALVNPREAVALHKVSMALALREC